MPTNKVTIHDIAEALQINGSTVSRALNNSPRVTQKTKHIIRKKAYEMGYQRNALASNLRKNKTNTLGVIVPRISRHFFSSAIAGIEELAFESGYNVVICQSLESLEREVNLIKTLVANRVDGLILSISMETMDYNHLEIAKNNGIPIVFFDRHCEIPENNNVLVDDFQCSFDATQHLINKGYSKIAHFAGPQNLKLYENRFNGYKRALEKNSIPLNPNRIFYSSLMETDGIDGAKKVLELSDKVDGIFSANDVAAIGAMQYLKASGIQIPNKLGIIGFSNGPTAEVIDPSLTTINQSGDHMGKLAVELLFRRINSQSESITPETIILRPNLIERGSTNRSRNNKSSL